MSFDEGGWGFERVVGMERVGAVIPPVVARIFSGDSTSPLTREARTWCGARDGCGFERVVGMADVWGWWEVGMVGSWDGGKLGWWVGGMAMDLQKNGRCC